MKLWNSLLFASLVLTCACEKSDNISQLHDEAVAIAKYYGPRVDELGKRRDAIFQRGRNVPGNLPDVPEIVRLIGEAGDKIAEAKGITTTIEKQADEAAKAGKADELARLIDESHQKIENVETVANDDLTRVESWLWQYEQGRSAMPAPPKEPPTPADVTEVPPGSGSAGDPTAPNAKSEQTEKAAQKAAVEKVDTKTGQPKIEPKPPAPTHAGSAGSAH